MPYAKWTVCVVGAVAAVGCAGKLDVNGNYREVYQEQEPAPAKAHDVAGSSAAWQDAGSAQGGAPAPQAQDAAPAAAKPVVMPSAGSSAGNAGSVAADGGAACDFRMLVQMKCNGASCHGGAAPGSGLDLTSAALPARVEGRKGIGSCSDKLLIDKTTPEQSALYLRVTSATCGAKMPLGGALSANDQACVLSWIDGL